MTPDAIQQVRDAGRVHGRRDGRHGLGPPPYVDGAADSDVYAAYVEGHAEGHAEGLAERQG